MLYRKKSFTAMLVVVFVLAFLSACGGGGSSNQSINSDPVADAGNNQIVLTGSIVTLDGSGSSDPDDDVLAYRWELISIPAGSTATLSNPAAISPTFIADLDGEYVVRLSVDDGLMSVLSDPVMIFASTTNSAPVAHAGLDRNVATGSLVTLDGGASTDADGDQLTFNWAFINVPANSNAILDNPTAVMPTFLPDITGTYIVSLIVSDGRLSSLPVAVIITAMSGGSSDTDTQLLLLNSNSSIVAGSQDSFRYFRLDLNESIHGLQITTSGGSGDVDLYVRYGNPPTLEHYDCSPFLFGNNETCDLVNPVQGSWYVLLHGYAAYSGVGLQAESMELKEPVQLTGMLEVRDAQFLDGTTPDPENPVIPNNTSSTAQRITTPATIGGYADSETDEWDVYQVDLGGATTILLSIADADAADLDLYLTDLDAEILASSIGSGTTETITTANDLVGGHLLWVRAFEGASNYLLAVDIRPASSGTLSTLRKNNGYLSLAMPVVTDEVVVKYRSSPLKQGPERQRSDSSRGYNLYHREHLASGAVRMGLSPGVPYRIDTSMLNADTFPLRYATPETAARAAALHAVKSLRRQAGVDYAEPNYFVNSYAVPNDPGYADQWHYPMINLPQVWSLTTGNDAIVTAVIDTGVVYTHPDLAQRMLRNNDGTVVGYDFIRRLADPFDVGDRVYSWSQSSFHGTHVAGTIGAATNNSIGLSGVTWQGKIMPVRVLGQGGGTSADIAQAIRYAAGAVNSSGQTPPVAAHIINLSLGPPNPDCAVQYWPLDNETESALLAAQAAGTIVVVAAGNDSCHVATPFSHVDGVINVGAVDRFSEHARYSNVGPAIDLVAPGGDLVWRQNDGIFSLMADDRSFPWSFGYSYQQGTSMAAPHVAGVLGLMLAVNPGLTPDDINRLIAGIHPDPSAGPITRDLGTPGRDNQFGHGLIDASLAVAVAQRIAGSLTSPPATIDPVLNVSTSVLNFGSATTTLSVFLENTGAGQLNVTSVSADAPWVDVDASNFPSLSISVDRTALAQGTHLAALTIQSNGGTVNIPVILYVVDSAIAGDIGAVYVLLLDTTQRETIAWTMTDRNSDYSFQLTNVQPGRYYLLAGTDRNADGFICDAGEACGRYPEFGGVSVLEVRNDTQIPGFLVNYWLTLSEQVGSGMADMLPIEGIKIEGIERSEVSR